MAKTLTTSWQTIGSYTVYPSGYELTFYMDARYTSKSIANNTTTIETRLRSVTSASPWSGDDHTFSCSYANSVTYRGRWNYENETITSGSGVITHEADGSKSVWLQGSVYDSAWGWNFSFGDTVYLPSIPRQANLSTAPDFTDEENPTVTYSNPAGNSVNELVISIYNAAGSVAYAPYRAVNKTGTLSYTFNLTLEERTALRQACTSNSMQVRFYLRTYLGGTYYYSYLQKTMTIVNGNPIFNDYTFADTNPVTVALTGNNQNIIKGYSNVTATISTANKAVANKEATMSKYRFMCGNSSDDVSYSPDNDVSITLNNISNGLFNVLAIDSRDNSKMVSKTANSIIDYSDITKGNITAKRSNGVSKETTLSFNGTWWNNYFSRQTIVSRNIQVGDDLSGKTLYFDFPFVVSAEENYTILSSINGKKIEYRGGETSQDVSLSDEQLIYLATYMNKHLEDSYTQITLSDNFGIIDYIDSNSEIYSHIYVHDGGDNQNTISAKYKYKKTSESSYPSTTTSLTLITSGNNYSFNGLIAGDEGAEGFDINYSYDIQVIVEDELSSVTFTTQLTSGIPHIAYAKNGVSIMGKYDDSVGGALQIEGQPVPKALNTKSNSQNDTYSSNYLNPSFAQIHPDFETKNIANGATEIITQWDTTDMIIEGKFEYDTIKNAIKIPAGSAKVIRLGGTVAGFGYADAGFQLWDDTQKILSGPAYGVLVQFSGNGYWKVALPNNMMIIPDTTKDYYLKFYASGYNATFQMNNGYGKTGTTINVVRVY